MGAIIATNVSVERKNMIKARGVRLNGRPYIWLGLEEGNIQRLKEGKPILFDMAEVGINNFDMLISYGKTQEEIIGQMNLDIETSEDSK